MKALSMKGAARRTESISHAGSDKAGLQYCNRILLFVGSSAFCSVGFELDPLNVLCQVLMYFIT